MMKKQEQKFIREYEMNKINFGCGIKKIEGYVNVDHNPLIKPDVLMDLDNLREYKKFKSNSADEIYASHILEHLDDVFEIMKEFHRILKKGGRLIIKVPHFSRGFTHSQHKRGFDVSFPLYFNKKFKAQYYGSEFQLKKLRLRWMIDFKLKEFVCPKIILYPFKAINLIINFLANISPTFCSRFWCFLVGGFEEIEFVFEKP